MCHITGVTYHVSGVACHVSGVTCQVILIFLNLKKKKIIRKKWWSGSVEGLLSTGPTPSSSLVTGAIIV